MREKKKKKCDEMTVRNQWNQGPCACVAYVLERGTLFMASRAAFDADDAPPIPRATEWDWVSDSAAPIAGSKAGRDGMEGTPALQQSRNQTIIFQSVRALEKMSMHRSAHDDEPLSS